jgi:hypothetical protein
MLLRDFLKIYELNIEEPFSIKKKNKNSPYDIVCLIDTRKTVKHTMSDDRRKKLQRAGGVKRRQQKQKYSYENVFNRIHGYFTMENQTKNPHIPEDKKVTSVSLICSSFYSNKRGVGTLLMNVMIDLCKEANYTDIILEVANEHTGPEETDDEDSEEEYPEEDGSDEEYSSDEEEYSLNEDIIDKLSTEFYRKVLRVVGGGAYYNIDEDYIADIIHSYMEDEYDFEDYSDSFKEFDISEPGENDYGGFWYSKGKHAQTKLFKFYEKFGFAEDGRLNYEWKAFTTTPFPCMILKL